ncbi:MAG: redoxin domain-containing protein [Nitrospiraceae bacterium]|nr:redoxin domain-containing protein [Nitrospiraceae bacterium]
MSAPGRTPAYRPPFARRIAAAVLGFCLSGALFFTPAAATLQTLQAGMEAPMFSLPGAEGGTYSLADHGGAKLTAVVFWSTWSPRSDRLLARMQKLHEQLGGKGLRVIGVNADGQKVSEESVAAVLSVRSRLAITFPLLLDPGLVVFREYGVIALPTTVLIDHEHVIVHELSGYPLVGSETMVDLLVATVEGKQPATQSRNVHRPAKNAQRYYGAGRAAFRSRSLFDTAESWFRKAAEADPGFALPRSALGSLYAQRGDALRAEASFREALAIDPGNPVALCELGMVLVSAGRSSAGAALFDAGRSQEAEYQPCSTYAAYALGMAGKRAEAEALFAEAERLDPRDYRVFLYRAKVFESQNERAAALAHYRKALELILRSQ